MRLLAGVVLQQKGELGLILHRYAFQHLLPQFLRQCFNEAIKHLHGKGLISLKNRHLSLPGPDGVGGRPAGGLLRRQNKPEHQKQDDRRRSQRGGQRPQGHFPRLLHGITFFPD